MTRGALVGLLLVSACSTSYIYGQTGPRLAAKGADCRFELLDDVPKKDFEELGILATKDVEDGGEAAGGVGPFMEAVRDQVCSAGGDAVVVERDFFGRLYRGTVIKYR